MAQVLVVNFGPDRVAVHVLDREDGQFTKTEETHVLDQQESRTISVNPRQSLSVHSHKDS